MDSAGGRESGWKDADCNTNRRRLTPSEARSLTLTVRFDCREEVIMMKGKRTFQPNTRHRSEDARVSGAHEHEERPAGAEAPPGEGPQAPDRQQRDSDSARPSVPARTSASAVAPSSSGVYQRRRPRSTAATARCSSCPTGCAVGRLGIAATKKLGGAVQRNRAKRLIREVFRRNKIAPGFDVVVVPKRELLDASLTALETEYRNILERRLRVPVRRVAYAGTGAAQRL